MRRSTESLSTAVEARESFEELNEDMRDVRGFGEVQKMFLILPFQY